MVLNILRGLSVLILSAVLTLPARAQPPGNLPRALADPALLSSRTWTADSGLEKAVSDWPLYKGKQGFDDKAVLREVQVQMAGVLLDAQYRVFLKDPYAEIVLVTNETKFDASFCIRFSEWTTPLFGVPSKVIDLSQPPRNDEAFIHFDAEWLFGATRVNFSCFGIKFG
jgi:hypothetical protein